MSKVTHCVRGKGPKLDVGQVDKTCWERGKEGRTNTRTTTHPYYGERDVSTSGTTTTSVGRKTSGRSRAECKSDRRRRYFLTLIEVWGKKVGVRERRVDW